VNNIKIERTNGASKQINIPIELSWDYLGIDQSIDLYEEEVITEVIGLGRDFEVTRFANLPYTGAPYENKTEINYEFYFHSGTTLTNPNNWVINYLAAGFTSQNVYYYQNNFSNSFFKLDFYDSTDDQRQVNYLTAIIPTQQGLKTTAFMQRFFVEIKKPKFILNYVGDKEGFFIYWLKKRNFLDIQTFYMTAKFYNAETGYFTRMINVPQSTFPNSPYTFDIPTYFYYKMTLDYAKQTYQIFNSNGQRMGTPNLPIRWYEYINP
jgi:hypothetical protein